MYANYNQVKLWSAKSQLPVYFISLLKYLAVFLIPSSVCHRTEEVAGKGCFFFVVQRYLDPSSDLRSRSGSFRFGLAQKNRTRNQG